MTAQNENLHDENSATQRHWLYGFNAFVLVLVGLVAAILIFAMCEIDSVKQHTQWDWSSNGANSLSSGSKAMLRDVDSKKQKYQIWSLFTEAADEVKRNNPELAKVQSQQRIQLNDLLHQYSRASANITIDDRGDAARDDIERQIRDKYKTEFQPYQDAVDGFDPLQKKLGKFLKDEGDAIGAYGQKPGTPPAEAQDAASIQAGFARLPEAFDAINRDIRHETDSTLPAWNTVTDFITQQLTDVESTLSVLSDPAKLKAAHFPASLITYFTSANDRYKAMDVELKAYLDKISKLPPLKVQDVLNGLGRNTIVIMGENSAKVIPEDKIFSKSQPDRNTPASVSFVGEQYISSALYSMANPNKNKVVFVTTSAQHLLDEDYSDMKDTLEQNNFEVLEWSPPSGDPQAQPSDPNPPAEGAGVVWVVFTPDAPNMQMMMQPPNPGPVISATKRHMDKGGQVLFMGEAASGMMGPPGFPYDDLIKDSGIEVLAKYSVLHVQEMADPDTGAPSRQISPFTEIKRLGDTVITDPIKSLPTIFGPKMGQQGQSGMPTVVQVKSTLPAGVEAKVLAATPYSADFWGESDTMSGEPKFDKEADYACPPSGIPLAAYSIKNRGQKDSEQRIAVIGSKMLGSNFFLDYRVVWMDGNERKSEKRFAGNEELMKNTILWLAGYENMIAVSGKANTAPRIGDVTPGTLTLVRVSVVLLLPLIALGVGAAVWVSRRR